MKVKSLPETFCNMLLKQNAAQFDRAHLFANFKMYTFMSIRS